jgi:hypothetical protein
MFCHLTNSYLCWAPSSQPDTVYIEYYYCRPIALWYKQGSDTDPVYITYALSNLRGEFNASRFTIQILHLLPDSSMLHIPHTSNQFFSGNASNLVKCWAICDIEVVNESCVGRCPLLISVPQYLVWILHCHNQYAAANRCIHASVCFDANQLTIDTLLLAFVFYLYRGIKLKVFDSHCDRCCPWQLRDQ